MSVIELDRWQFEKRLHHCVEYQFWEKLQRLRDSTGRPAQDRRRSSAHILDSLQRPRSQPELRHVPTTDLTVSDQAFLRKVSAKAETAHFNAYNSISPSTCTATKSVTFVLPRGDEVTSEPGGAPVLAKKS